MKKDKKRAKPPLFRCSGPCGRDLPDERFARRANKRGDAQVRRGTCYDCDNARRRLGSDFDALTPEDFDALTPEDFDVSVANDGRRIPGAAQERRQEFSRAMGEYAEDLHASDGKLELMTERSGGYVGKLSEQERRFGNRRLARSVSLAAAHEALALRQFKQAATEYLSGHIVPTGYALKKSVPKKRTVCLLLSDLHLGAELSGVDNPIPFGAIQEARRLEYVVRQAVDYKPQYRKDSELLLLLNGDLIDGLLLHDLRDGAPLTEQKMIFYRHFRAALGLFAQTFPRVRVECQPGNHGRDKLRHPGRATSAKWDSHEWQMYAALELMCSSLKNVTFSLPRQAVSVVDLYGSTLGMTHGDTEVKTGNPDTFAARNGAVLDRINSSNLYGVQFDAWAFGHHHVPRYQPRAPRVIWNGALIPPNGYARSEGYVGEPCGQFLWEAVEGYPVGDLRFIEVGRAQDNDERLGTIIPPFRFSA